mmetsp:Transcript_17926/g.26328  ORF Transcript_17926/g.26328 Transcript_17926/m.26328 type:complete len:124 (-) Transcript_17926:31-402(-)
MKQDRKEASSRREMKKYLASRSKNEVTGYIDSDWDPQNSLSLRPSIKPMPPHANRYSAASNFEEAKNSAAALGHRRLETANEHRRGRNLEQIQGKNDKNAQAKQNQFPSRLVGQHSKTQTELS